MITLVGALFAKRSLSLIRSSNNSTAFSPISRLGCATVVKRRNKEAAEFDVVEPNN